MLEGRDWFISRLERSESPTRKIDPPLTSNEEKGEEVNIGLARQSRRNMCSICLERSEKVIKGHWPINRLERSERLRRNYWATNRFERNYLEAIGGSICPSKPLIWIDTIGRPREILLKTLSKMPLTSRYTLMYEFIWSVHI